MYWLTLRFVQNNRRFNADKIFIFVIRRALHLNLKVQFVLRGIMLK